MKTIIRSSFVLTAGLLLPLLLKGQEVGMARVTEAVREVNYRSGSELDRLVEARVGQEVRGRDILSTGGRSRAELLFENDILTRLGSNSIFSFEPDERVLSLEEGLALVRVPKGNRQPVRLRTPAATAAITGTTVLFSVQTPAGETNRIIKALVLEGELQITYPDGQVLTLGPGKMAISSEGDQSPPDSVDVDLDRLYRTSGMIHNFERELGSERLIEQAVGRQARAKRAGILRPSGLRMEGTGTSVGPDWRDRDMGESDLVRERNRELRREREEGDERDGTSDDDNGTDDPVTPPDDDTDPPPPDAQSGVFQGEMNLAPVEDESGSYRFQIGEETIISELYELVVEGEPLTHQAQAIQGFETIFMGGSLLVEEPMPEEFLFVATGEEGTQPADTTFTVDNLSVRYAGEPVLNGEFNESDGEFSFMAFLAERGAVRVRGDNSFINMEDVIFASLGGDVVVEGNVRVADEVDGDSFRGGSANIYSETGTAEVRGTVDASGEGTSAAAHGGWISVQGGNGIHLTPGSRLDASRSDHPEAFFDPYLESFGNGIDLTAWEGRITIEGDVLARGGLNEVWSENGFIHIEGAGVTMGPEARIDASAYPVEDSFAPGNGGWIGIYSQADDVISGELLANASPFQESVQAGSIHFGFGSEIPGGESSILFDGARVEATGGSGGHFLVAEEQFEGSQRDVAFQSTTVDVSGTSSFVPSFNREPEVHLLGRDIEMADTKLIANANAAAEPEDPQSDGGAGGEQGPRIAAIAQRNLVIRNSTELSALVNGGELPGGSIYLDSWNGSIQVGPEESEGEAFDMERIDARLEAGSISAIGSRNIAFVDSYLRAWQGDIRLVTSEQGSIRVVNSMLNAREEIFLKGGTVDVHGSNLTAREIRILRNSGEFNGNTTSVTPRFYDFNGNPEQ